MQQSIALENMENANHQYAINLQQFGLIDSDMQDVFGDLDDDGVMLIPIGILFKRLLNDKKLALDQYLEFSTMVRTKKLHQHEFITPPLFVEIWK